MKSFRAAPRISRMDVAATLVPMALWIALIQARPMLIHPFCATTPTPCTQQSVFAPDRMVLGMASPQADFLSFVTQDLAGALAASVPLGWSIALGIIGRASWPVALAAAATDLVILTQTTALNGFFTELAHLVGRPRPFVYANPLVSGLDPANYTSFYSGHTSFAAAAGVALILCLLGRGARPAGVGVASLGMATLAVLTGIFRMLAGRHFLTDVIAGGVAGAFIAYWVAAWHRSDSRGVPGTREKNA